MSIINNVLSKVLGSNNERLIKKYTGLVAKTSSFESQMQSLSDQDLADKTNQFRERLNSKETLR